MLTRITRENLPTHFNPMWRTSECSYEDLPFTKSHHSRIQLKDMCALVPPPFSVLPIFFRCQTKWGGVLWSRYEPWWVRPQTVWHDREWRWRGVWGGGVVLSFLYGIWWHLVPVQQLFSCVCVCGTFFFFSYLHSGDLYMLRESMRSLSVSRSDPRPDFWLKFCNCISEGVSVCFSGCSSVSHMAPGWEKSSHTRTGLLHPPSP